jgi:hypothetical protein
MNIISDDASDVFGEVDLEKKQMYKKMVFSMIISTDMSFHNQLCKDFEAIEFKERSKETISANELKVIFIVKMFFILIVSKVETIKIIKFVSFFLNF